MNPSGVGGIVSSRSLKLVAAGVSLLALTALALLAVGFFVNDTAPPSNDAAPLSSAPAGTREATPPDSGSSSLHEAIATQDAELVRILIEGGANVDVKDVFGEPALHEAIALGDPAMVNILVEAGADVNAKNVFGDPALHRAILNNDVEIVRILVDAGADVNINNAFGDSAVSRAVQENNKEILRILTDEGTR